jgi:hypothetical protein
MKKLITFLLFTFLVVFTINGQTYYFQSTAITTKLPDKEWSDWEEVTVNIKSNFDSLYINVHRSRYFISKEQKYMILEGETKNSLIFFCIDHEGEKCIVEFVNYKDTGYRQIYIRYEDIEIGYQIIKK